MLDADTMQRRSPCQYFCDQSQIFPPQKYFR